MLDLLAFEADVGDPVLAAGVGAAGDVELDLLVEAGEAVLPFRRLATGLKALVSAMASLQNSVPVQAMAPRQKGETSTSRPMAFRSAMRGRTASLRTLTRTMFCMMVARRWPSP